ncbi:hypothetical protein [Melissospora conviva]|uniref:hypothetical protein n=1 Tax=Melissospora conviva TaxID=3388432 RepID=UPI003B7EE8AF
MANEIEARRTFRTRFMNWVFDQAKGSRSASVRPELFLKQEGIGDDSASRTAVDDAIDFLEGEGLLRAERAFQGVFSVELTHLGIREIEQARTRPDQPTEHFVPMVNVLHIGTMIGSQVQQGSPNASQYGEFSVELAAQAREFIEGARAAAEHPAMSQEDRDDIQAQLALMDRELNRNEPRPDRLKALGIVVRTIILNGLGGALGSAITTMPWYNVVQAFAN